MPRLRSTTSASFTSPLASVRAFLHSIMPAPVRSRSCFTSCALISIVFLLCFYTEPELALADCASRLAAGVWPLSAGLAVAGRNFFRGCFRGRRLTRQRHRRQILVGNAFRHELLGVLGVDPLRIGGEFFRHRIVDGLGLFGYVV